MTSLELLVFHRRALRKIVDGTSASIMPLISAPFFVVFAQQCILVAVELLLILMHGQFGAVVRAICPLTCVWPICQAKSVICWASTNSASTHLNNHQPNGNSRQESANRVPLRRSEGNDEPTEQYTRYQRPEDSHPEKISNE
jgi:hypothetical protein